MSRQFTSHVSSETGELTRSSKIRNVLSQRAVLATVGLSALVASNALFTSPSNASATPSGTVNVVGYSVVGPAYIQLEKAFRYTSAGKHVTFTNSFGASGDQSRAVVAGQPADVVNFSLTTDMERLVSAKLVSPSWNSNPIEHGMVTDSVVVFIVPKGNPDHIKSWSQLTSSKTRVFTPNPFSSGSARWNLMAAYGAEVSNGPTAADNYLSALLKNTVVQGTSAATELTDFLQDSSSHKNDVLLDYEDDALQAKAAGDAISYVIPKQTILIENPIAVTSDSKNPVAANAFVSYLESPKGQALWAQLGFRSVRPAVEKKWRWRYPDPAGLFTIQSLGGWDNIATSFFGSKTGSVTKIEESLGQSTTSG